MNAYRTWLDVALKAAEEAASHIREAWRSHHTVESKGFRDIVTETDRVTESIIVDHLTTAFPDHSVTAEERGSDSESEGVRWFVDPIDGTTNFSRDNPNFSLAIGAVEGQRPVVAVVCDPLRSMTFAAVRGCGATLNGERIRSSRWETLDTAVLGIENPRDPDLRREMLDRLSGLYPEVRSFRALGSAVLSMTYVAAGWIDAYFSLHVQPWDQTASALLVEEAGGVVSTVSGRPWNPYAPDPLMAATPALMKALRQALLESQS